MTTVNVYATGSGVTDQDKILWETYIDSAWSGKFKFKDRNNDRRYWEVRFDVGWASSAAAGAYAVNVQPAATPLPTTLSQADRNLAKTYLPEAKDVRHQVASHRDAGTLDMGTWARGDAQAFLHEFGHMIGCPDEYTLVSCSSSNNYCIPYDAAYNVAGYSTDSIMNNPDSNSKVYPRHLDYVRRAFEAWNAAPLKPASSRDSLRTVSM